MGKPRERLIIDNVMYNSYSACPTQYNYRHVQGIRREGVSLAFAFGGALHTGMDLYYSSGNDIQYVLNNLEEAIEPDYLELLTQDQSEWKKKDIRTYDRLVDILIEYHTHYKGEDIQIVEVNGEKMIEKSFIFPVMLGYETENCIWDVYYVGKIDAIVKLLDLHLILDHKTTRAKKENWLSMFEYPNNQFIGYVIGANTLLDINISGCLINQFHLLSKKNNFDRGIVQYEDYHYKEWYEKIELTAKDIIRDREANVFKMSTTSCHTMYGDCAYKELCGSIGNLRNFIKESKYIVDFWTPLENEELEAING